MSTVQEQIRVGSVPARVRRTLTGLQATEQGVNTGAGLWDNLDSTADRAQDTGNGVSPANLVYAVDYDFNTPAYQGNIDIVRVKLRRSISINNGSGLSGSIRPLVNGGAYGTADTAIGASFSWAIFDFPTNPVIGGAWLPGHIGAYHWGFRLTATATELAADVNGAVSEILIDILGPDGDLTSLVQVVDDIKLIQAVGASI